MIRMKILQHIGIHIFFGCVLCNFERLIFLHADCFQTQMLCFSELKRAGVASIQKCFLAFR